MIKSVYLAGGVRTPMGAFQGQFADVPAPRLGSAVIRAALARAGVDPKLVDEVIMGCVLPAGAGQNVARQAALGAGLPASCGATTVNKVCGSAMRAVRYAAQAVQCGDARLCVAGGMENMTRAPYLLPRARGGYRMGDGEIVDSLIHDGLRDAYDGIHMGVFADRLAAKMAFSREAQDDFGIGSFQRAIAAQQAGRFKDEIAPVEVTVKGAVAPIDRDETMGKFNEAKLRTLRPAFDPAGTVAPGNASSIADGAAAVLVVGEEQRQALRIPVQARILGYAGAAVEPAWFTLAPIDAIRNLCRKLSLKVGEVDLFEINEAFALVVMAAMQELSIPREKVNVHGGAIALGHPLGASGARILVSLMNALKIRGGRIGIAAACIGGGEAGAIAVEMV